MVTISNPGINAQVQSFSDSISQLTQKSPVNIAQNSALSMAENANSLAQLESDGLQGLYGIFLPAMSAMNTLDLQNFATRSMNSINSRGLESYVSLANQRDNTYNLLSSLIDDY